MDVRTSGIILRTRLLTETSLIVHWLTPDLGRIATVAKGARRPKSSYRGKLDLFYTAEFSFSRSSRSELHNLREVMLRETHGPLRQDFNRLQQAAYGVALIELTTEVETPLPEIHELFLAFIAELAAAPVSAKHIFAFELQLLELLGMAPELEEARLSSAGRHAASVLMRETFPGLRSWPLAAAETEELRQFLHGFLIFHLGKLPRGRAEALHV